MERNYTTQMDAARRGIVTPELETVARKEHMSVEELMPLLCELDKVMIGLQHGVLHREQTIASGGGCCDYFITGDREQLKPEDKN